jgi:3D (Asp-Asp-Asp) domain-containing protein
MCLRSLRPIHCARKLCPIAQLQTVRQEAVDTKHSRWWNWRSPAHRRSPAKSSKDPHTLSFTARVTKHSSSDDGSNATKVSQSPSRHRNGKDVWNKHSVRWMRMVATWYDGRGGINGGHITATGAPVQEGVTIVVDPKIISLGSRVEVRFPNGTEHTYVAQDTGGAIVGNRLDIFDPNPARCLQNGVQVVDVRILGGENP